MDNPTKEQLREEMEKKLLANPKTRDVVLEMRRQRDSAKANETEQQFYGNMFKTMKDSLEKLGETNTVKSQTELMQKNTETVFMLADGLSLLIKALGEQDNTDNLLELQSIKGAITKLAEKKVPAPIVNIEAPIVKIPEAKIIDKSTVIQETKEIQEAVKILGKILEKVSVKQNSIVKIGNVDPDEAVAVRMVDKNGKNFVDLMANWFIGGSSGGGFPGNQTDLDTGSGTDLHGVVAIGLPASGGFVVGGTTTNPLNVTGTFTTSGSVEITNDTGNPIPVNGTVAASQSGVWTVTQSGAWTVTVAVPTTTHTGTTTTVGDSASSVTLLAANTARSGGAIRNDSSARLYIEQGATATTSSVDYLDYGDVYELPILAGGEVYRGIITGIWASDAGGSAYVRENV